MNKFVIARIEKENELVGLRVLTTDFIETKKIVDASLSKIKGEKFDNMEVDSKGEVKSLNQSQIINSIKFINHFPSKDIPCSSL